MTIRQVVSALQKEKQEGIPSRFPCRAIMVKNVEQYCLLLSELKKISDIRIVQSSEIFSSFDVMPTYDNLQSADYHNQWVILTGVSEYLRLFSKKEAGDRRFASLWAYQAPASSTGRIIIPLWGCEAQWFDTAINLFGDLRQQDFYYDCTDSSEADQQMNLLVLSGVFEQHIGKLEALQGTLKCGLQEWFEYWENPSPDNHSFVLLTKRFNSITTTNGSISVHVVTDIFSFIQENMHGADVLTRDACTTDMQTILFGYSLKGLSLDEAILKALNVSVFCGVDVMGKWSAMSQGNRRLVALWLKLHPDDTYLCHCFAITGNIDDVVECIGHDIFNVRLNKPEWIPEYQKLVNVLDIKPDEKYFEQLNMIPEYENRLEFLTNGTREERIYLLRMVGNWMRKDPAQVKSCSKLQDVYPALFAYLCHDVVEENEELLSYMARYKSYKLENTLPDDEEVFFNGVRTQIYDYRFSVLSDNIDNDTVVLWIDALGIEWFPLLKWTIEIHCDTSIAYEAVGMATLPTETCYNEQWNEMTVPHIKLDKLDKLAHRGVIDEPDYYACIEEQLTFVEDVYKQINSLLEKHHRVIITGDHGTSRLAARFFHAREGITAPKDAKVCSHGRYCVLSGSVPVATPGTQIVKAADGVQYAVFENYGHFKQSGFAAGADDENAIYGEVHGGATPEEMLVPVIVLDSNKETPLTAFWEKEKVKIAMKKVKLKLNFSKAVNSLVVEMAGISGLTVGNQDGLTWTVTLAGIKQGIYHVTVVADGQVVSMPDITVQAALSNDDGDLP